jgi:hypothetical protein
VLEDNEQSSITDSSNDNAIALFVERRVIVNKRIQERILVRVIFFVIFHCPFCFVFVVFTSVIIAFLI